MPCMSLSPSPSQDDWDKTRMQWRRDRSVYLQGSLSWEDRWQTADTCKYRLHFLPSWSCLVSLTRESFLLKPVQLQLPTAFSGVPKRPSAVSVALSDASGHLPVMFPFLDPKLKPFKPGPGSSLPTISLLVSLFLEDPGMLFSSSSFSSA